MKRSDMKVGTRIRVKRLLKSKVFDIIGIADDWIVMRCGKSAPDLWHWTNVQKSFVAVKEARAKK